MTPLTDIAKSTGSAILKGVKDNGPLICTIGATVGLGTTLIFSVLDTKNYMQAKSDEEAKIGRELTTKECFKVGAPEYIRTVIAAGSTAALTWGAFGLNKKIVAGLNSSLLLAGKQLDMTRAAFRDYREETQRYLPQTPEESKKIEKIIGGRKSDIPRNSDSPNSDYTKPGNVVYINDPNSVIHFKEVDTNVQYFKSWNEFNAALNKINADINTEGWVALNRFYEYLGVEESEIGWDIGWDQIVGFDYDPSFECESGNVPEFILRIMFSKCPTQKCR